MTKSGFNFNAERGGQFSNSLYEDLVKLQKLSEELEEELREYESVPESHRTQNIYQIKCFKF